MWEASRQLGTARKAEDLPKTKDALKRGDLSPDQADAVTDAATADPAAEDDLLRTAAADTNKKLREESARRKAAATDAATRERRNHAQRSCRRYTDADGAWNLRLRGTAVDGVRSEALVRPYEEAAFRTARTDGRQDTFENRAYDAVMTLLGLRTGGDPSPSEPPSAPTDLPPAHRPSSNHEGPAPDRRSTPAPPPAGTPPTAAAASASTSDPVPAPAPTVRAAPPPVRGAPGGNNVKVIVLISHTALARGHTIAGETCEVAGLGPISVAAAKELLGDAFLAAVITRGRDVVDVAHLGRGLSAHQRTAIEAMGLRCSNLACNRTVALQIDHRVPFADDPVTALDNQDPLCPECHRLKTHHGHHLEEGRGPRRFLPPARSTDPSPPNSTDPSRPNPTGEGRIPPERIEQPSLC